jgi:glutathione synthase/RimK-type ligase-like ATP-grasp enzyme
MDGWIMTGWLIVNEFLHSAKFSELHNYFLDAAVKYKIKLQIKTNAELLINLVNPNTSVSREADFILFWDKDVRLASYLETLGYPVFNSSKSIEICDNKALTQKKTIF